ncbi:MAG: stage V sporulation protein AE [Eubacteriales bacterium]|nr:stage V sporulation protein AE [Eubacteriales bacterium]MDD4475342.1 stage V sporulation protein AE [Eubacteriales bacterium]
MVIVMFVDYLKVFVVGGLFCVVAQILIDKTKMTPARILVGYVCTGVVLGALGIYKPILEFAGAGASVPLTGFGYQLAEGVRRQIEVDGLLGALTGGMKATSGGISAAILFGLLAAIIFKSKPVK